MLATLLMAMAILKEFGPKAKRFAYNPPEKDARINILHGSVRSSKTWSMIPKIMYLCRYDVGGMRLFSGVSKQTIYDNVLNDLFDMIDAKDYHYNRQSGEVELYGTKWLAMGAKDEGSEKYLRGKTVGIAYVDELTLLPKSFVMMLLNRMSPTGARLYATTNPDNPFHFVKTDLLDNKIMRERGDVWSAHFTLADNPNVSDEYKAFISNAYTGIFKRRYVLGEWVVAEGSIYRDSWNEDEILYDDESRPPGLLQRGGYADHFIPCDYGTTHRHVYLDIYDDGKTLWVEREYVWDSQATMQRQVDELGRITCTPDMSGASDILQTSAQKTDKQYVDDLIAFMGPNCDAQVIVPPEAASFDAELTQRGIWKIDADNEVMDGIRMVSTMLQRRLIRIHRRCCCLIERLQTYAWDEKAALRGEEQPLKVKNDEPDALRYGVKTKIHAWRLAA
jgi:PBSX family phage terminase large subunit